MHDLGGNMEVHCYTNVPGNSVVASCDISSVTLASNRAQFTWHHIRKQSEVILVFDALQT